MAVMYDGMAVFDLKKNSIEQALDVCITF